MRKRPGNTVRGMDGMTGNRSQERARHWAGRGKLAVQQDREVPIFVQHASATRLTYVICPSCSESAANFQHWLAL